MGGGGGDRADKRAGGLEEDIRALGGRVHHFQLSPKRRDGATLIAGGHLWSEVIDYAGHRGRRSGATGKQKGFKYQPPEKLETRTQQTEI